MKALAIIPLACLLSANLSAQRTEQSELPEYSWYKDKDKNYHGRFTVAIHPSQLLSHANFRIDAEMRLKDTRNWLQLGLDTQLGGTWLEDNDNFRYEYPFIGAIGTGTGFGLNFNYKHFFHRYFYAAGGPSWHYYDTSRRYHGWSKFVEDGIEYNEYGSQSFHQKINNVGFNAMCGFQKINRHNFLVDVYLGVAAQKAFHTNPDADQFNSMMYSRGYSGCVFLAGFRIGFAKRVKNL